MELTDTFAEALRHLREQRNLSQEQLAAASGLDRTYISQLERGMKSPTLTTLEKLAECLRTEPQRLLRRPRSESSPRVPRDYHVAAARKLRITNNQRRAEVDSAAILRAVNTAHDLIDDLYATHLDVAAVLGLRNLSAFIGELVAAAILKETGERFRANPHQDGYPDLLLMDRRGQMAWEELANRQDEKGPFSPFPTGGIEVKATCGSVPTPEKCRTKGMLRPNLGTKRIGCMSGFDWKAHHRDTNNLLGVLWDFIEHRPRIAALFYAADLDGDDWGKIVQPKDGGGRTTSVSIMSKVGLKKMSRGWLCVHNRGGYAELINRKAGQELMPGSLDR